MSYNRLMGPKEHIEIILCEYQDGRIFYQFNGLDGAPCQPHEIHRLLTHVAAQLTQPTDGIVASEATADPGSRLFPQEAP